MRKKSIDELTNELSRLMDELHNAERQFCEKRQAKDVDLGKLKYQEDKFTKQLRMKIRDVEHDMKKIKESGIIIV